MKNNICKLCGENCGRRRVCLVHKIDFPYIASWKGSSPFNRFILMNKEKQKEEKHIKFLAPEELVKEVKNG